jgi:hypothetical protein
MARELSLEHVKMPSWQVHGHRLLCGIQRGQLIFQLSRVGWLDAGLRTGLEELLQAGVPERSNHFNQCNA